MQVSAPLHAPSPQVGGQAPQSDAQVVHVSPPLQIASPQPAQAPQSAGQVEQVSPPEQLSLPQLDVPQPVLDDWHSDTQIESH